METQAVKQNKLSEITKKICQLENCIADIDLLVCDLTSRLAPILALVPQDTEKRVRPIDTDSLRLIDRIQIHIEALDKIKSKIVSILDRLEI